jgi:hypothetical protein
LRRTASSKIFLVANPSNGPAGTEITLTVNPGPNYRFKSGTLKYAGPAGDIAIDENTLKFNLPAGNVTVTAEFERAGYTVGIASL